MPPSTFTSRTLSSALAAQKAFQLRRELVAGRELRSIELVGAGLLVGLRLELADHRAVVVGGGDELVDPRVGPAGRLVQVVAAQSESRDRPEAVDQRRART